MIQRIQSVYLALAAVGALISAFLFPMWTSEGFDYFASANTLLFSLVVAIAVFSFIAIFLFKNRAIQMKLCTVNMLLVIVSGAYIVYQYFNYEVESVIGIAPFFLLFPLVFNYLAKRSIKKDDDLIRSVDRIR